MVEIGGLDNALDAAELYRRLRETGRTVRSPIDVLLAPLPPEELDGLEAPLPS